MLGFNMVRFEGDHFNDTRVGKCLMGQNAQCRSREEKGYQCERS